MIIKRNRLTPRQGKIYCDVYDYIVKDALKKHKDLEIQVGQEKMTLPYKKLKDYEILTDMIFKSKWGGKDYKLFSYKWQADKKLTEDEKLQLLSKQIN